MKLSSEVAEAMRIALDDFKMIFGRQPRRTDPVLPGRYSVSAADHRRETLRALEAAKVRPQIIYAFLKTGRVVHDARLLTSADLADYEAAIDEFEDQVASGRSVDDLINPATPEALLRETLRHVQIIGGYYIDRYINSGVSKRKSPMPSEAEFMISFAVVNFVRCLRSTLVLIDNDVSYDAYYLVRSLYENYPTIRYLYAKPDKARVALEQLKLGSTEKKGKVSTAATKLFWPVGNMADELNERDLYEFIYRPLSLATHSLPMEAHIFIDDSGFNYLDIDVTLHALCLAHEISMRTFNCLRLNGHCQAYLKRDLFQAVRKSFTALSSMHVITDELYDQKVPSVLTSYMQSLIQEEPALRVAWRHISASQEDSQ